MGRSPKQQIFANGRTRDWMAAGLLLVTILLSSGRLMATDWTEELGRVHFITGLAVIAGMAIGYSRFSPFWSIFFATAYGLFAIPWQMGLILGEDIMWKERLLSIAGRLNVSVWQFFRQENVTDPLLFLTLMALLYWILGASAGYRLIRQQKVWRAILPAGVALLVIHGYDPLILKRSWYLAFYLLFGLMLVSRMYYLERREEWEKNHTHLPLFISVDMMPPPLAAVIVLVIIAWVAPIASSIAPAETTWQRLTEPWQEVRDDLGRAFKSLKATVGVYSDSFGDSMALGQGNPLSDHIVFTVEAPARENDTIRFYWRARVYDIYLNNGWHSRDWATTEVTPNEFDISLPEYEGRWEATFAFDSNIPMGNLHVVSQPEWISRPVELTYQPFETGLADIQVVHGERNLLPGEKYEVQAAVTNATEEELRNAGTDYPDWVLDNYLQVPDSIPIRVHDLAREIVQDETNVYDAVNAITQYLRENVEYQDSLPPIPEDREAVDWILFDYQKAFCNYYATTEIVLLRSLGIPARMAVGYAQGVRTPIFAEGSANIPVPGENEERAGVIGEMYAVRQSDLHAWPEVYFPGIGWVEFEPTGNQFPIQRIASDTPPEVSGFGNPFVGNLPFDDESQGPIQPENFDPASEPPAAAESQPNRWLVAGLIVLGVALIAVPTGYYLRKRQRREIRPLPLVVEQSLIRLNITPPKMLRRWAFYTALTPIERAYLHINQALTRLNAPPNPYDTPAERANRLADILPNLKDQIVLLGNEYQNSTYGRQFSQMEDVLEAGKLIRNVSWIEKFRRWFARFQEPAHPSNNGAI